MNLHTFKIAYRNIIRNKWISLINVIGFAFAMTCCLFIALYIFHEFSFNKFNENHADIYRLYDFKNRSCALDSRVKEKLLQDVPEIKDVAMFNPFGMDINKGDESYFYENCYLTDTSIFNVFSIEIISGDKNVINNSKHLLISENMALKIFNSTDVVGKEVLVAHSYRCTIGGVFKNMPSNSSIQPELIANHKDINFTNTWCSEHGCCYMYRMFALLYPGVSKKKVESKIINPFVFNPSYPNNLALEHLGNIYLYSDIRQSWLPEGNLNMLRIFLAIALVILIIASINHVNITLSRFENRYKEAGIKKTIGASKSKLITPLLTESILITIFSMFLSLLILHYLSSSFESLINKKINFEFLFQWNNLLIIFFASLALGVISGLWPSIKFAGFSTIKVISGKSSIFLNKTVSRNFLTVFQYTISIAMIASLLIMFKQLHFIKNKNLGFNDENLIKLDVSYNDGKGDVFIQELTKNHNIISVSKSNGIPGNVCCAQNIDNIGTGNIDVITGDSLYIATHGISILEGNNFTGLSNKNVCLINKATMRKYRWKTWEDKKVDDAQIIGVFDDFHYQSMHNVIEPLCIKPLYDNNWWRLSVRISGNDLPGTIKFIRETWSKILPDYRFNYEFFDTWFDTMYKDEERLAKLISSFAVLAIIISCLGILGLSIFTTERRIKEIGVRKVNGANIAQILSMLNIDLIKWILLGYILACPLAWFAMNKWLDLFAYRTMLSWWIFVFAGLIASVVALITISVQSWHAAVKNPVESLRYE